MAWLFTLLQYLISFWERVVMAGTIDSKTKQTLKDIANKLRIHSINSTTAAGTGWVYNTRLSDLLCHLVSCPIPYNKVKIAVTAHSITIECSNFSSCGNVQFWFVCFENWSISLMQNELFYLSLTQWKTTICICHRFCIDCWCIFQNNCVDIHFHWYWSHG